MLPDPSVSPTLLPDPADEPTLTMDRTAAVFKIARNSAYAAAARGEIPTIRIGRRLLVPTAALRKMLGFEDVTPDEAA